MEQQPFPQVPLSALGRWADENSRKQKAHFLRFQRLLSGLGVVATAVSLLEFSGKQVVLSILLASMAALTLRSIVSDSERNWYVLRALAESIKRVEWRALMGSFGAASTIADSEIREIWKSMRDNLSSEIRLLAPGHDNEIAEATSIVESTPFDKKKAIYREKRILDQINWYQTKAVVHIRRWRFLKSLATFLLLVVMALAIMNLSVGSMIPALLSVVAYATAENALGQNSSVASAYGVAADELREILSMVDSLPEAQWPQFVSDSEEAISREHGSWRASRELRRNPGLQR